MKTAWQDPKTWAVKERLSASKMNTWMRDQQRHIKGTVGGHALKGVHLRTHPDADAALSKVMLVDAESVQLESGFRVTSGMARLVADVTVGGANGLDTGAEAADACYEIYLIQKPDETLALLLHKSHEMLADEVQASVNATQLFRDVTNNTKISQGFQIDEASAPVMALLMQFYKLGTPTGNMWVTIETDSSGSPSGVVLATSQKVDVSKLQPTGGAPGAVVFIFDPLPTLSVQPTQYHYVLNSDVTINGTNHVGVSYQNTDVYARGQLKAYNGSAWSGVTGDAFFVLYVKKGASAVVMPSGYDDKALIGYVRNGSGSNFRPFAAWDRLVIPLEHQEFFSTSAATPTAAAIGGFVPHVPIRLYLEVHRNAAGAATRTITVGGVPDGYEATTNHRASGVARLLSDAPTAVRVGPVHTRVPLCITKESAGGTFQIRCDSWEW